MRKKLLFTALLVLGAFSGTISAQNRVIGNTLPLNSSAKQGISDDTPDHRTCATMDVMERNFQLNPMFKTQVDAYLQDVEDRVANGNLYRSSTGTITVPVVFHVVYNTSAQNISDAQLQSQLDILNADYAKTNSDASNIPSAWTSTAAATGIQFCLATKDPNGNATNGITRTQTSTTSFSTNDNVKHSSTGGQDIWNRDKYLNIWVCNLGGGLLGYAQFPSSGPASEDGVVIHWKYTGNSSYPPFNKGRTATHEVGHWFGLYHIWGDDGGACSGSDLCADTPNQAGENYNCPTFPRTDACTASSPGVMFMNYMDYVNDGCMYMFTNDQSTRMNATLSGARGSLIFSDGCSGGGGGGGNNGACGDTIGNPLNGTPTLYTINGQPGYVTGHNGYLDKAKANRFENATPNDISHVDGVKLEFGVAKSSGPTAAVTVAIWNEVASEPGTILGSQTLLIDDIISANGVVWVPMSSSVSVSGPYYVGIQLTYAAGDTVALICAQDGQTANVAWEQWSDNTWYDFTTAWNGFATQLAIYPWCDSTIVGISEVALEDKVLAYPNPNNGQFSIEYNSDEISDFSFRIMNSLGQTVYFEQKDDFSGYYKKNLDLTGVAKGVYHLQFSDGKGTVTKKVVVQ